MEDIERSFQLPEPGRIKLLARLAQAGGNQRDYHPPTEYQRLVGKRASELLISIPGHAQYLAEELEEMRETIQGVPRGNQNDYDWKRYSYLVETFSNLPSPEAIKVFGAYLNDERDKIAGPEFDIGESAYLALYALSRIGLRDAPVEPMSTPRLMIDGDGMDLREEPLAKFRKWYAEVIAGKRSFSFIGQDVEYRFTADGSVETSPLPESQAFSKSATVPVVESDPASPRTGQRAAETESEFVASPEQPEGPVLWWWLAAGALVVLAASAWIKTRRAGDRRS